MTQSSEETIYVVNERRKVFFVDNQGDVKDEWCRYLDRQNGGCQLHDDAIKPLVCHLEGFMKIYVFEQSNIARMRTGLPGRSGQMSRIDGGRGARCKVKKKLFTNGQKNVLMKGLLNLQEWMSFFDIQNDLDSVIEYILTGPHDEPLQIVRNLAP